MKTRKNPRWLAEKLKAIRYALHKTQRGMIKRLCAEDELFQSHTSAFEDAENNRTPSYTVLLKYARATGISTNYLIDDEIDLPKKLPLSPPFQISNKEVI